MSVRNEHSSVGTPSLSGDIRQADKIDPGFMLLALTLCLVVALVAELIARSINQDSSGIWSDDDGD